MIAISQDQRAVPQTLIPTHDQVKLISINPMIVNFHGHWPIHPMSTRPQGKLTAPQSQVRHTSTNLMIVIFKDQLALPLMSRSTQDQARLISITVVIVNFHGHWSVHRMSTCPQVRLAALQSQVRHTLTNLVIVIFQDQRAPPLMSMPSQDQARLISINFVSINFYGHRSVHLMSTRPQGHDCILVGDPAIHWQLISNDEVNRATRRYPLILLHLNY